MAAHEGLIRSAIALVRSNGVAATGVTQLLAHSGICRCSVYLNFPGGKSELIAEATRVAGSEIAALIESSAGTGDPSSLISSFIDTWKNVVESSDFTAGCPIAAAVLGRSQAPAAADIAGQVFQDWEQAFVSELRDADVAPEVAVSLATTIISTIEGAVLLSLAARSTEPLDRAGRHLIELTELHVMSRR